MICAIGQRNTHSNDELMSWKDGHFCYCTSQSRTLWIHTGWCWMYGSVLFARAPSFSAAFSSKNQSIINFLRM